MEIYSIISQTTANIAAAIIIILIGLVLGRFLGKAIQKVLNELETNKLLKAKANINIDLEEFVGSTIKYIIYFIALILSLNQVGLTPLILKIILIIILILMIIFIVLAVKDYIPNVVAGFILHQKKVLKEGNIILFKDIEGKVIHISLIETRIETKNGDIIFIPNSVLMKKEIVIKK